MNKGEHNELLLKVYLIHLRDKKISTKLFGQITSVSFNNKEYASLPTNVNINNLKYYTKYQIISLCNKLGIAKSPPRAKSDVYINGNGYSVKSVASAPPALVNHTTRPGFEWACSYEGVNISVLDNLVSNYWSLRRSKQINEDISNKNEFSPFTNARHILQPLLNYFLFKGTGSGLSKYPADFILDYIDPLDDTTWGLFDKHNVVDYMWNRLTFSLRSKGMPNNYPMNPNNLSIQMWTNRIKGKYKGALHIRLSKNK